MKYVTLQKGVCSAGTRESEFQHQTREIPRIAPEGCSLSLLPSCFRHWSDQVQVLPLHAPVRLHRRFGWQGEDGIQWQNLVVSKYFLFLPQTLGKISNLTIICFRWVGSTTNQKWWLISFHSYFLFAVLILMSNKVGVEHQILGWFLLNPKNCDDSNRKFIRNFKVSWGWFAKTYKLWMLSRCETHCLCCYGWKLALKRIEILVLGFWRGCFGKPISKDPIASYQPENVFMSLKKGTISKGDFILLLMIFSGQLSIFGGV